MLDCSGVLNERTLPVVRVQHLLLRALHHLLAWPQLYRRQHIYTSQYPVRIALHDMKHWPLCFDTINTSKTQHPRPIVAIAVHHSNGE